MHNFDRDIDLRDACERGREGIALTALKGGATGAETPFSQTASVITWPIKVDLKQIYCSFSCI